MTTTERFHEATAVASFLRACDAGLGSAWFTAKYSGECALTHTKIKPGHRIAKVGDGAFVRRDAIDVVSIRGNESVEDVLDRFAWADRDVAAAWLATGDSVLLFTGSTLKPKMVGQRRALGGCSTLDKVHPLFWHSVAFMLRQRRLPD